jgi:16S rRNA (adenine1518-N6/adenine1519-N6)-dimethyltransferase
LNQFGDFILGWVRSELRTLRIPPLKRYGQHFLLSQEARDRLIDEAKLSPEDTVVEVGAGLGFITAALASRSGTVLAIEKDRTLAKHLESKFSTNHNVQIIQGDALSYPIPTNAKIVSSPPYNISSKLVLHILKSKFRMASLLLQEDFVNRLTASNGSRDYGRLTVILQTCAKAEYVAKVSRSAFYPEPRVDSAIATIHPTIESPLPEDDRIFEDLVRALFTQRRRKSQGVLSRYLQTHYRNRKEEILARANLNDRRVYELSPIEFVRLSNLIAHSVKG